MAGLGFNNRQRLNEMAGRTAQRGLRMASGAMSSGGDLPLDDGVYRPGGPSPFEVTPYDGEGGEFTTVGKREDALDDKAYNEGWDQIDESAFMTWLKKQPPGMTDRLLESYHQGQGDSDASMGDSEYFPSNRRMYGRDPSMEEPGSDAREDMYDYYHGGGDRPGDDNNRPTMRKRRSSY